MSEPLDFADGAGVLDLDVAWIHGSAAATYNTGPVGAPGHRGDRQRDVSQLADIQATLREHDLQPGRYALPRLIITPV